MTISIGELQRKLRNISKDMTPALLKAMTDAAQNVEGKAKENCPVITGTLRRSISSKAEATGNEVKGVVGANTEYAEAVHEGTSKRPPQPFILDAVTEKENETLEILGNGVEEAIRRYTR